MKEYKRYFIPEISVSGTYTQFEKAAWVYWILEAITSKNSSVKISQSKTNDRAYESHIVFWLERVSQCYEKNRV